jgi:hypothetical protein
VKRKSENQEYLAADKRGSKPVHKMHFFIIGVHRRRIKLVRGSGYRVSESM